MSENTDSEQDTATDAPEHLEELPDGSGCTEIWEHISENRDKTTDSDG